MKESLELSHLIQMEEFSFSLLFVGKKYSYGIIAQALRTQDSETSHDIFSVLDIIWQQAAKLAAYLFINLSLLII